MHKTSPYAIFGFTLCMASFHSCSPCCVCILILRKMHFAPRRSSMFSAISSKETAPISAHLDRKSGGQRMPDSPAPTAAPADAISTLGSQEARSWQRPDIRRGLTSRLDSSISSDRHLPQVTTVLRTGSNSGPKRNLQSLLLSASRKRSSSSQS